MNRSKQQHTLRHCNTVRIPLWFSRAATLPPFPLQHSADPAGCSQRLSILSLRSCQKFLWVSLPSQESLFPASFIFCLSRKWRNAAPHPRPPAQEGSSDSTGLVKAFCSGIQRFYILYFPYVSDHYLKICYFCNLGNFFSPSSSNRSHSLLLLSASEPGVFSDLSSSSSNYKICKFMQNLLSVIHLENWDIIRSLL